MPTTPDDKSASSVRPPLLYIGTDARGRRYDLVTVTEPDEIVVRDADGVVLTDQLHELTPRDVARTVKRDIGWADCRFAEMGTKRVSGWAA